MGKRGSVKMSRREKIPYWSTKGWYEISYADAMELSLLKPIIVEGTNKTITIKWAKRNRGFYTDVYLWIFCISTSQTISKSTVIRTLNDYLYNNSIGYFHYVIEVVYE